MKTYLYSHKTSKEEVLVKAPDEQDAIQVLKDNFPDWELYELKTTIIPITH